MPCSVLLGDYVSEQNDGSDTFLADRPEVRWERPLREKALFHGQFLKASAFWEDPEGCYLIFKANQQECKKRQTHVALQSELSCVFFLDSQMGLSFLVPSNKHSQ